MSAVSQFGVHVGLPLSGFGSIDVQRLVVGAGVSRSQKHHRARRVGAEVSDIGDDDGAMAQPHKGPRRLVQTRIPEQVYAELVRRAHEAGTSTSQYIADSMAISVGRDDLVWELGREREALPLAM
jgi:hypothetical protein